MLVKLKYDRMFFFFCKRQNKKENAQSQRFYKHKQKDAAAAASAAQRRSAASAAKKRIRNVRHNKNIFNLLKLCSALHFVLESNTGAQTHTQIRRTISLHLHSHTYTHAHAYIESRVADKKIRWHSDKECCALLRYQQQQRACSTMRCSFNSWDMHLLGLKNCLRNAIKFI